MATTVYVMPTVFVPSRLGERPEGKYFADLIAGGTPVAYQEIAGAEESYTIVIAKDVPLNIHNEVAGHADAVAVPPLEQVIGAQLATVKNKLEILGIPSQWVQSTDSYASVCRVVIIFSRILSQFEITRKKLARITKLLSEGRTWDTRWNQLDADLRTDLRTAAEAAAGVPIDTSGISGGSTLRQVFKAVSDQWQLVSLPFGDIVL